MLLEEYIDWALVNKNQTMYMDGQLRFLTGGASHEKLALIDSLIAEQDFYLFPISQLDDALVILTKLFPAWFATVFSDQRNVSSKDQSVTPRQSEKILQYSSLDAILFQKSETLLRSLKNRVFPDPNLFSDALNELAENTRRRNSMTRKVIKKSAQILTKIGRWLNQI